MLLRVPDSHVTTGPSVCLHGQVITGMLEARNAVAPKQEESGKPGGGGKSNKCSLFVRQSPSCFYSVHPTGKKEKEKRSLR